MHCNLSRILAGLSVIAIAGPAFAQAGAQSDWYNQQDQQNQQRYQQQGERTGQWGDRYDRGRDTETMGYGFYDEQPVYGNQDQQRRQQLQQQGFGQLDYRQQQFGQQVYQGQQGQFRQQGQFGQQDFQRQQHLSSIEGRVVELRTLQVQGQQDQQVIATIRTQQGQTVLVDLGSAPNFRDQNIQVQQGDQISLQGYQATHQGQPLIVATQFQTQQGQQVQLDQGQRQAQQVYGIERGQQQMQQGLISGRVTDARDVQIEGVSNEHRLVRLQTREGRQVVVDLGPEDQLNDLSVQQGDWLAVRGQIGQINNRPVIFAQQVANIVTIDRSGEQIQQSIQQALQQAGADEQQARQQARRMANRFQENNPGQQQIQQQLQDALEQAGAQQQQARQQAQQLSQQIDRQIQFQQQQQQEQRQFQQRQQQNPRF